MKIAVVSDLHAFNSKTWNKDGAPSYFDIANGRGESQCPIKSMQRFSQRNVLSADYLLCPGDLSNNACSESLPVAWAAIHEIGSILGVKRVLGTVGNHDVDSRHIHNIYDPIEELKKLHPQFPVDDRILANQFWSEHFFVLEDGPIRFLVINSSAYHATTDEIDHGRVAEHTLGLIRKSLDHASDKSVNVLICHHNPQKHSEIRLGESDEIKGGQLLLDLIGEPYRNNWMVIHGHKHHPKITYASGGVSSAIVFSAGSAASTLYPELIEETGNQFYIIEIDEGVFPQRGLVGRFQSWDWHPGFGWRDADAHKGLPSKGGFGHRENPMILAHRIKDELRAITPRHVMGDDIFKCFPDLEFVAPGDLRALERALKSLSILCSFSDEGPMTEICEV